MPNKNVLAQYVPRLVSDAVTLRGASSPGIEQVNGTMVFADLSGFTALSERLAVMGREGAEQVTETINFFFSSILEVTDRYGGDNLKFGGDALLLLFTGDNHADRAVRAVLTARSLVKKIGKIVVDGRSTRLGMSFGIHSGDFWSAVAGKPGDRMLHYMLGSEVRKVAQAESEASSGQVVISSQTLDLLSGRYAVHGGGEFHRVVRSYGGSFKVEQTKTIFASSSSPHIADYIPIPVREAMDQAGGNGSLPSEHRKAWVIFMGVEGFEDLLERSGPDQALDQLTGFSAEIIDSAQAHGGLVLGTDIDEYGFKTILLLGVPRAKEEDAANAGRLAIALRENLKSVAPDLHPRIGLNSGFVFSGDVGSPNRRDYTVMGDAVNLSARLMNVAKPGEIIVSDNFISDVGSTFIGSPRDPVRLKGKAHPQVISLLLEERPESDSGLNSSKLLGRDAELAQLNNLAQQVERGSSQTALIHGPIGIGKSRITKELSTGLFESDWSIITGNCRSHTTRTPYSSWRSILEQLCGIDDGDSIEQRTSKVEQTVQRLAPTSQDFSSLLNGLLGVKLPENDIIFSLDAESQLRRLKDLVVGLLEGYCKTAPLLLIIEDIHWADVSSHDLVSHVIQSVGPKSKLFLLASSRESDSLAAESISRVGLYELDSAKAGELLSEILGGDSQDLDGVGRLIERTGGNPLFIEEVAAALTSSSALPGSVVSGFTVPDRLQTLVMSRIDALPAQERDVLRMASVVAESFDASSLARMDTESGDPEIVIARLASLARLGFVDPTGTSTFTFRHAVVQEACYDSLAYATRRRLHREMVTLLEESDDDHIIEKYETLLHHSENGRDKERTLKYGVLSAQRARSMYAFDVAINHYETSLTSLESSNVNAGVIKTCLFELIGDCHAERGRYPTAAIAYQTALRQWRKSAGNRGYLPEYLSLTDRPALLESALTTKVGASLERSSEYNRSIRWLDNAIENIPNRSGSLKGRVFTVLSELSAPVETRST
ncbi:MAG: AAA family ATPase [Chloroflexi bacterium]|nr:AAA family ATPase [Chloroflexota bacterium]